MRNLFLLTAVALSLGISALAQEAARPAASATQVPATQAAAAVPPAVFMESVVVAVDGKADFAGNLQLEVLPLGGTTKAISVNVLAKEGKKDIAKQLHRELTVAAGSAYKVKLSGAEIRITKASKKSPNLSLTIQQQAVTGVSLRVSRG
jgi:beta-lactamase class A